MQHNFFDSDDEPAADLEPAAILKPAPFRKVTGQLSSSQDVDELDVDQLRLPKKSMLKMFAEHEPKYEVLDEVAPGLEDSRRLNGTPSTHFEARPLAARATWRTNPLTLNEGGAQASASQPLAAQAAAARAAQAQAATAQAAAAVAAAAQAAQAQAAQAQAAQAQAAQAQAAQAQTVVPWSDQAFEQGLMQGQDAPHLFTLPPKCARALLDDTADRLKRSFSNSPIGAEAVYREFAQQLIDCHRLEHKEPATFYDFNDPEGVKDFSQTCLPDIYGVARHSMNGYMAALNYFNVVYLPVDTLVAMSILPVDYGHTHPPHLVYMSEGGDVIIVIHHDGTINDFASKWLCRICKKENHVHEVCPMRASKKGLVLNKDAITGALSVATWKDRARHGLGQA